MPVAIHVGDPEAFFLPIDRFNERFEELNAHPDWSFHGKDFPSLKEMLEARDRVFAKHPNTTFVGLHVGHWAENLQAVGETLDRFRNVHVEIGARIGELGGSRAPRQNSSTATRTGFSLAPMRSHWASKPRSRCSARSFTGFTTDSSKPRTSTSTTRRRNAHRRVVGRSTASVCPTGFCARSTMATRSGSSG